MKHGSGKEGELAAINHALILFESQSPGSFNFITYALGGLDFSNSVCFEKILTDHELLGMIERMVRGVEVTDQTLAVDVIDEVGPGGHFLASRHKKQAQ